MAEKGMSDDDAHAFARRRAELKARINVLDRAALAADPQRVGFFSAVYDRAEGDATAVPWADLKPKEKLAEWLAAHPGEGQSAIDIACGLGDNAEALAHSGYATTAFDITDKAIAWASQRFPGTAVDYRVADLLNPPSEWIGAFDLVNECYTIQSVPPQMHEQFSCAVVDLVKPGGTLLIYTRLREEGAAADGPPWPLMPSQIEWFSGLGLDRVQEDLFDLIRPDRTIAHSFSVWRKRS